MIIQSLFGDSMFFPLGILEAWDDEGPTGVEKWWVHIEKERKKKNGLVSWTHEFTDYCLFFSVL